MDDPSQHLSQMIAEEIGAVASNASAASPLPVVRFIASTEGPLTGQTIGKYKIEKEIGRGGMGTAYLATDNLGRAVVVKAVNFVSQDASDCQMRIKRFEREARAASRIEHPNIVRIWSFDVIDGRHLLVMEHVDGHTLTEEVKNKRALLPEKAAEIIIGVLTGLEAIHAANVVHRDLKPGNIMLTQDGRVKILDFGLGTTAIASGDLAFDETLTQAGIPVGTPSYMSPEQINALKIDARSDLYAVGVILFQLLAGTVPFVRENSMMSVLDKHRHAPVPKIVSPLGPLPSGLQRVVEKAMAKRPEDRYQSAAEMRSALQAIDFSGKPPSRRIGVASALGLAAFFVLAASLALVLKPGASSEPPRAAAVEKPIAHPSVTPARHAEATVSGPAKVEVPSPPVPVPTVADGCTLFEQGRTSEAIAALTRVSASSSESLYCLCGAYARQSNYGGEMQKACKTYLGKTDGQRDQLIAKHRTLVGIWLGRVPK